MPKKPAYATEEDLGQVRQQLQNEVAGAKNAGLKAASDLRTELLEELGKLSQTQEANREAARQATDRVAADAAQHAQGCANTVRTELEPMFPAVEEKFKASLEKLSGELQQVDAAVRETFEQGLLELAGQLEQEIGAVKAELQAGMERWGREAAEALVAQRKELSGSIEELRKASAAQASEFRELLDSEFKRRAEEQKKVDDEQNERNERSQNEVWLKLDRLDDLLKEARADAQSHTEDVDARAAAAVSELRADAERRLEDLDQRAEKLHDAVAEVENLPTRRVDWVIRNVSKRIRPPSASKACLHTSWFSPKFDMAGAHGLQLELQFYRDSDPPVEGQNAGDCAVFLWACRGMNLVYKLYIGTKSATLEKVFNGRVPYGTKRLCFLKDMINREEDSLRVSVEILEAVREIEHTIKPPPPLPENATEEDALTRPLEGKVVLRRHINNRLTEQVKTEVETMRSRMVRRVEWRLENATMLRRCFPPGEPMCSVAFAAAGVAGLQLMFYPCGYQGSTDGFCSLFLYAPAGATLKYTLYAGTHRRDATNFFEEAGAFGRTNFCRFESVVEEATDSILLSLEIEEAHQDLTAKVAHPTVAAGDRRSQAQIDGAVPAAVESVVKMQRAPGKLAGGLEERRVLPSLWTAKTLGEKSGPNDMKSFEDLKTSRTARGQRSEQLTSPLASSPLSGSRSVPSLSKELASTDASLPQLSKSSTDWASSGLAPKKLRASSRTRRGMGGSTMQVLETGAVH